jgi:hypothetical protein
LHVDLEQHVGTRRRVRDGCSHQVVQHLGPLEEAPSRNGFLEGGAVDELVGIALAFTRARRAGGPAAAQPELRGVRDECSGQCALAGPTGTDEDEDARLARVRISEQSL